LHNGAAPPTIYGMTQAAVSSQGPGSHARRRPEGGVRQPALGLVAGLGVITVSLAVISLFSWTAFSGWVAYALMSATPTVIIAGSVWPPSTPALAQLPQPARGLAMLAIAAMIGAASAGLGLLLVGHSVSPPIPALSQFAVDSIPVAFWLCLIWECWPFARLNSRIATAGALIIACYAVNYGVYELLVGSGWMAAPTLDAVSVSAVALMFLMLQFELWPLTHLRAMDHQPTRGAIWTVLVLAGGIGLVLIGTQLFGTPADIYMARAPIPFIFGCILTLNTFQGSLVAPLKQPLRGVCGSLLAAGGGLGLGVVYRALTPTLTGHLSSVPPTYERATWLASALLGVTFLFLSLYKDFLGFWPLVREAPQSNTNRSSAAASSTALTQP
jgi:hypothetical protein